MNATQSSTKPHESSSFEGKTIFHEEWWLNAVTNGSYQRLTVDINGRNVGVLPIFETSLFGFKLCQMPPFTHVLGPAIDVGEGSDCDKLQRRFKITTELINKLPNHNYFNQVIDCSVPETIAFQAAGYFSRPHYTFLVDCSNLENTWKELRLKPRQNITRSRKKFMPVVYTDSDRFIDFYIRNLYARNRKNVVRFRAFSRLYEACKKNDSGEIFAITDSNDNIVAAIFVVWGYGKLYYLMSARDKKIVDNGVVSLLLWRAIEEANTRSLVLDVDGIVSSNMFTFLSGFGGTVATRKIVTRRDGLYGAMKSLSNLIRGVSESTFY